MLRISTTIRRRRYFPSFVLSASFSGTTAGLAEVNCAPLTVENILGGMSSFEKLCCAFDENFVRCAHWRLCNANSSAAVELFARNGTPMEPRLRIDSVHFKTLHSIGAGKSWKISSFGKTRQKTQCIPRQRMF